MEKILVSACLAGEKTRYDGKDNAMPELIDNLAKYFDLVFCCPEVMGGLPTPRDPSEIRYGVTVVSKNGKDVTKNFVQGASEATRIASFFGIRFAVLKEGSPSCGSSEIHDGSFSNRKIKGMGFTAKRLSEAGIKVYNETNASELIEAMAKRDQKYEERDRIRAAKLENAKKEEAKAEERQEQDEKSRDFVKPDRANRSFSGKPHKRFDKSEGRREGKPFHSKPFGKFSKDTHRGDKEGAHPRKDGFKKNGFHKKPDDRRSPFKKDFSSKKKFGDKE